ncbi:MAG: hypothetical protein RIS76_170 [Verrucomicrobiota bacterium]|jgi:hypothetical protein
MRRWEPRVPVGSKARPEVNWGKIPDSAGLPNSIAAAAIDGGMNCGQLATLMALVLQRSVTAQRLMGPNERP